MKSTATPKTPKTPKTSKRKEPKPEDGAEINKENDAKRPRQQHIMSFFQRVEKPAPPPTVPPSVLNARFKPFQLKEGMRLAPLLMRRPLTESERDNLLNITADEARQDFLKQCATKRRKKRTTSSSNLKAKLFQFHDNYRPPYYGTWRHRNANVNGRRMFNSKGMRLSLDGAKLVSYEVDSDDDWEEEPADGDECNSDEDEKEDEVMDEEEEENDGFFVEHGYLSAGEGSDGEDEEGEAGKPKRKSEGADGAETEEQRRKRLEQKNQEWLEQQRQKERRARRRELKPVLYWLEEGAAPQQGVPPYHRFCRPAVLFDYSKLVVTEPAAMAENGEARQEEEEEGRKKLETLGVSEIRWAQAPPTAPQTPADDNGME